MARPSKPREPSQSDLVVSALIKIQESLAVQQHVLAIVIRSARVVLLALFLLLTAGVITAAIIAAGVWGLSLALSNILGFAGVLIILAAAFLGYKAWREGRLRPSLLAWLIAFAFTGITLTGSWSFSLFKELGVDVTFGKAPLADCEHCAQPDLSSELRFKGDKGYDLECGGGRPRSVGLFRDREPPAREGIQGVGSPLEDGNDEAEITNTIDSLRRAQRARSNRSLAGIILIGSTDERPISSGFVGKPHPSNGRLALARARWVGDRLKERLLPFEPSIMIINSGNDSVRADLPLARAVLGMAARNTAAEHTTSREVLVCGLWRERY